MLFKVKSVPKARWEEGESGRGWGGSGRGRIPAGAEAGSWGFSDIGLCVAEGLQSMNDSAANLVSQPIAEGEEEGHQL